MDTQTRFFKTGNEYTLGQLFSRNHKIIIPDLQRDYCWGLREDLAKNFVLSLLEYFHDKKVRDSKLGLGMIYGYEDPENHIQLCDGQQRITTLFLLIGMINRKSAESKLFQNFLVSEDEMKDDKEPYLQYSIRESTLYFLSDLVQNVFFSNRCSISGIKEQHWYFKDYDLDPSIQSMLLVLEQIDKVILDMDDLEAFGKFLLNNLSFLYYDMGDRRNGEETYVIINTTGEPLTATENLKPILLSKILDEKEKKNSSDIWEKWENFFWANRQKNDTSDNGLKEFFRWIMLITLDSESLEFKEIQDSGKYQFNKQISIAEIDEYFKIILFILTNNIIEKFENYLAPEKSDNHNQISWFQILPTIKYIKRFGTKNILNIKRVYHFFANLSKLTNIGKAISDLLPEALKLISVMSSEDICSFLDIPDISKSILTEEEKLKFEIYKNNSQDRENLESLFWKNEDYELWNGEIKTLLLWSTKEKLSFNSFNKELFVSYSELVYKLLMQDDLDYLRRTLITFINNDSYPEILHGYINYSFCNSFSDWKFIFDKNYVEIKNFLDLLDLNKDIVEQEKKLMNRDGVNIRYNLDKLIKHEEILKRAKHKNFQWDNSKEDWLIIPKEKATIVYNLSSYVFYLELVKSGAICKAEFTRKTDDGVYYEFSVNNMNWYLWYYIATDGNCCVISSMDNKYFIDINSTQVNKFILNVRSEKNIGLDKILSCFDLELKDERYYSDEKNQKQTIRLLQDLINVLSSAN